MKITFMGTSHGYAEKKRFTSATLIEVTDLYYLLDAGGPVEWLMINADKPLDKIRSIFITHMHNDHIGNLTAVIEPMLRYRYNDKAACFFPTEDGKESFLDWSVALDTPREQIASTIKLEVTHEGKVYEENGLTVTARPTLHMQNSKAYAYIFDADGKKVLFTGDMGQGFPEYLSVVGTEHYDLVVCEMAHANISEVQEMLKQTNTDRMIITHYFHNRMHGYEEILKTFPFPVSLAADGDEIIL